MKFKENCKKESKEVKRKTDTVGTHTLFKYWYSGDLPFRFEPYRKWFPFLKHCDLLAFVVVSS